MKTFISRLLCAAVAGLMCWSTGLRAEDIDIYVDNATTVGVPNVLFVIDSGANFESSAAVPCTAYASGGAPSLGASAGGIEQCALVNAIEGLAAGSVNIGVMVNNNNNFAQDTRATTDAAYHEVCQGTYGGCLARKLTLMDAAGKTGLINFIKSWKTTGQNSASEFNVKSGGDRTGNMMQEAWAYFNGKTGMSGKNYGTSILGTGCQRNFIIFIGNAFNNSGGPADSGSESPYNGSNALTSAQVGATTEQKAKISETVSFTPATCGVTSIAATTSASNWSENWADEWARLLYKQDGGAAGNSNTQNVTTYTIGVVNDAGCKADYPALLSTMAKYGGGKYYKTSTTVDLQFALQQILNEVQAVNSVFSSASLPVSVNAEGSYLNQIYLGMFRPDQSGAPRWMGNLKQYQLVKIGDRTVLGDNSNDDDPSALSSSGTGFISPNAISFWTYKNTNAAPDTAAIGGFWVNDKKGVPESGYDSPDGEVVEKGGVAQQIRKESLTSTFTGARNASTNPRRLYTYCPSGTGCNSSLTDSANDMATTNSGIPAGAFGSSTTLKVASIVRTGTTALVTTNGAHGLTTGNEVTISNAGQAEYNVTQNITVNSATTFTITGLPDYPTSPATQTYRITPSNASSMAVTSVYRTSTGAATETVTVVTGAAHGFTTTSSVSLAGITPTNYNLTVTPTAVSTSSFTFNVTINPSTPSQNAYTIALAASSYPALGSVSLSNPADGSIVVTATSHGIKQGQTFTISSATQNKYNGTYTATSVTSGQITVTGLGNSYKNIAGGTGTLSVSTTAQSIAAGKITRAADTGGTALATIATGTLPANWFGYAAGDKKYVNIIKSSGSNTNESAYALSNVEITCLNAGCTGATYSVTVSPSSTITLANATASVGAATAQNLPAGTITRSGATATITGLTAGSFSNGQSVNISAVNDTLQSESAYVGTWTLSCSGQCTTATFGNVTLTPTTPATGSNIQVYAAGVPPDRDTLIKWVRGADNYGDEKGPGGTITVRPSVHGDVLHSRPLVINYGDSRGIVVFYGANDGVFRAVNGNQTAAIGSVPAGGEMWGLVLPEHYTSINRLRLNSPELKFPSTVLSTAQKKDYFVDGPTGAFQKVKADGTIDKAYIYLTMRRGGRFMYGVDVSQPNSPTVLWKISNADVGFSELGQTWSRPRSTVLQGGNLGTTPVLIFGAGYDTQQDSEPPGTDIYGRGIYIINALTGALIWSATPTCTSSATCLNVPGLTHSVPADVATVDRDNNGYTDKLYFGDMGGNIWRVDVSAAATTDWKVTKIAALGCATGACSAGTTPRKFMFPPSILTVRASGAAGSYDLISLASGDREHPLMSNATGSSYGVADKFFTIKDTNTAVTSSVLTWNAVTLDTMFNATSTTYDGSGGGFYVNFAQGEKGVNAPLAVSGKIFFSTNKPVTGAATCEANLGEARAYAIDPFTGASDSKKLAGGGLPPSPVAGLVTITKTDDKGNTYSEEEKFCIGCSVGCEGATCNVALENTPPKIAVPKNLKRTYWYKK